MASRTVPMVPPRRVAKGASRIARGKMFAVVTEISTVPALFPGTAVQQPALQGRSASQARMDSHPALVLDDGLGAMRGLAFVLVTYLAIILAAFGALMVWRLLR